MADPEDLLNELSQLLAICDIVDGADQRDHLLHAFVYATGIKSIPQLSGWCLRPAENAKALVTTITDAKVKRGNTYVRALPANQQRLLGGLLYWIRERKRRGQPISVGDCSLETLNDCWNEMELESKQYGLDKETKPKEPGNCDTSSWFKWELKFENFLGGQQATAGGTLAYVIRRDKPATWDIHSPTVTETERRKYQLLLTGREFTKDNKAVWQALKARTVDTPAWTYIKEFQSAEDGRSAMAALRLNYEGGPEAERRIALANSQLKLLHWKNESVYSFENFKTQLKEHLDTLDELNRGKNAHEKVEMLMEKIQPAQGDKQADIRTEKILCKAKYPDDFEQAATYMATKISQMFPNVTPTRKRGRERYVHELHGRGRGRYGGRGRGRYGGRGRGRGRDGGGGRGGGSRGGRGGVHFQRQLTSKYNGVNTADPKRDFSSEEWAQLGADGQAYIRWARQQDTPRTVQQINVNQDHEQEPTDQQQTHERGPTNGSKFGSGAHGSPKGGNRT